MRTTITFADDVAALIAQRRAASGAGVSTVVNDLIRRGAITPDRRSATPPALPVFDLRLTVDVRSVGDVLAMLDEHGG